MSDQHAVHTVWMDGEFVDVEDAQVNVLTHGLHYGTGIFEGVRYYETEEGIALFRWEDHLARFRDSANPYGLDIDYDDEALGEAAVELVRRHDFGTGYVRPMAFFGAEPGLDSVSLTGVDRCPTRVAVLAWARETHEDPDGIDVMVSSWRKHASDQIPTTSKATGPYVNSLLASREAHRSGRDDAIVLNKEGAVAEGATSNLFLVRDGELFTPGVAQSPLEGITRRTVITLADELGYPVDEDATINRGELYTADELFLVGTAKEIAPIRRVDNVTLGEEGPITREIRSRFFDVLKRRADDHEEWFTYID